jgi:tetratricopeptide (TPR) repeat protein
LSQDVDHLTPTQVEAAAREESGKPYREHLEVCADCRKEVADWRDWNQKVRLLRAGESSYQGWECPSIEELASFAAGLDVSDGEHLLEHFASCDRCGAILRDGCQQWGEENAIVSSLSTATPEWQKWMGAKLLTASKAAVSGQADVDRPPEFRSHRRPRLWWFAAAALVLIAVGAGWEWQRRANDPARLLAMAYTVARPFDYRLPDRGFGPVRQQRSSSFSAFDRPEPLVKAETEIQASLKNGQRQPEMLLLKGRAELIEGQYESAIDDLTRASELTPSAAVLADLGAAHALRGDAEQRNFDYGHAIDLLLRALRLDPKNLDALFNLAITYEKVSMIDESIATWNKLLALEPAGPWADEARQRLAEVEKKKEAKKTALGRIAEDPNAFLAMVNRGEVGSEAEYFQNIFWSDWLPETNRDPVAAQAARALADIWVKRFGDSALLDAYHQATRRGADNLLSAAGATIIDNIHGHNDEVLARAVNLTHQLAANGQRVAEIRTELELAYSYRRSTRHEPCLVITDRLLRELEGTSYAWLAGRTHLEHSICVGRAGGMGPAREEREETAAKLTARGLRGLALQAGELVTSIDALSGNSAAVWEMSPKSLTRYWDSAATDGQAQQALYDMAVAAKDLGWKEAAIITQAAAVEALAHSGNKQVEALNRVYLASLLREAGHQEQAIPELDRADRLFRQLPQGITVRNLMLAGQLRKAEAEASGPTPAKAILELDALSRLPDFSSLEVRMRAQQARGIAFAATGDWRQAENCFREAIRLAGDHVRSFNQPLSRIAAAEMALDSRHYLVQIALLHSSNPAEALRTWELRWADLSFPPTTADVPLVPDDPSDVVLTYVVLPAGVASWVTSRQGIRGGFLPDPPALLESKIREFHRLCASPTSNLQELRADGRNLYERLVQPYAREVKSAHRILIESDEWLSSLPFGALVDENGHYVAERHAVGMISSLANVSERGDGQFSPATPAVIVSVPGSGGQAGLPYLPGAELESSELASRMTASVLLDAALVKPDAIARKMASARLVHFAGHGWSNGGNAALILGPDAAGGRRLLTATDLAAQSWKQCRLAVLSACLTATGEERGPVNPQSLVRALLAAGALRVVASRWSIDSASTRVFMRRFYESLFKGASPAVGLEQASANIRVTPGWEHPYYWAAFDVFGAP